MKKHILTFSGGKDSLALICWAKKKLSDFEVVFCDTGWEHDLTYQHIKDIQEWMGKEIITLKNAKYPNGFIDLCLAKKRVPSTMARFCTEELKVKPMIDYLLSLKNDIVVYQGIRSEESRSRAMMKDMDEYFRFYFEPKKYNKKGNPVYDTYRKKYVTDYCNEYTVDVNRPLFRLTANEVFNMIFDCGLSANPLYYMGFSRVGCMPCIQGSHSEIKLILERFPHYIEKIRNLENELGSSFFPPKYIPDWACTGRAIDKNGKAKAFPWIDDVVKYVRDNPNQIDLYPKSKGCQSVYAICETQS